MRWLRLALIPAAIIILLILSLLILSVPVEAYMLEFSLADLVYGADTIIIGSVDQKVSRWNTGHTAINTQVLISIEESLKGSIAQHLAVITVPGGTADGITEMVSDEPEFKVGERMVLFLKLRDVDDFAVYGLEQGKMTVWDGKVGSETLENFKARLNGILSGTPIAEPTPSAPVRVITPQITSITPSSASAGTNNEVVINGTGFGRTARAVNFFYRSGQPTIAGTITSWTDTSISVIVPIATIGGYPASASSGPVVVRNTAGIDSPYFPFTVTFSYGGQKWPGSNPLINYYINENTLDCTGEGATIQNTAATWNAVTGKQFAFIYAGTTGATIYGKNSVNEILWRNYYASSTSLAHSIYWLDVNGNISETDIEFNDYYNWSTATTPPSGQYDVETILLHEMGHWLNLRDLYGDVTGYPSDSAKVMYGYGSSGATKRTLAIEDISGIQWIYPVPVPNAPSNLTATAVSTTRVNLTWQDNSADETGFRLERKTGAGGTYVEINTVGVNVQSYPDSVLTSGTTYYYRVRAYNDGGNSTYSNEANATTQIQLIPPTVLSTAAGDITAISATLNGNLTSLGSAGNVSVSFEWGATPAFGNATPTQIMNSTGAFSASLSSLTANTTYYYRAKAVGDGTSYGGNVTFTTLPEYTLTLAVNGNGTTTPPVGNYSYPSGTVVSISAAPSPGWQFVNWMGNVTSPGAANTTVIMDSSKTVTANFSQIITYNLAILINGGGNTTPAPGNHTYMAGTSVNITATPFAGWAFSNWSGDANGTAISVSVTMSGNKTVTAIFQPQGITQIGSIKLNPALYGGFVVSLNGTYRGWESGHGTPPVTRSDWVIQDGTGAIYVTGSKMGLNYPADVGKPVEVTGRVKTKNGVPYLEISGK